MNHSNRLMPSNYLQFSSLCARTSSQSYLEISSELLNALIESSLRLILLLTTGELPPIKSLRGVPGKLLAIKDDQWCPIVFYSWRIACGDMRFLALCNSSECASRLTNTWGSTEWVIKFNFFNLRSDLKSVLVKQHYQTLSSTCRVLRSVEVKVNSHKLKTQFVFQEALNLSSFGLL